ncbi:heat shock 70 kDa protein 12A, putative [Rhizoctonia solani AG-3 Rhs1AP]|uniref:Heat shock 70 kDa protein 12A, putative n=1 Tax=Rhizoctonia solani AG-3 Rhs1AP TaxID=1086054 RepID=X8J5G8_9AGAM|nr:heat shock 70 kDa protein 12A, putative [Rhizoctonia solani AG-3 Rhs1AP]
MPLAIDDVPWSGRREFVVGLDIGTAHSSVTFSRLEPGKMPLPERVTHWPSAAGFGGTDEAKTASKLYYDKFNKMTVAGAEVYTPRNRHAAKDNDWHLVRYFKLLLHPPGMANLKEFELEALPNGLTIETVYTDIIRYMLEHTRRRINDRPDIGTWEDLSRNLILVIAHPNGWGIQQQSRLRSAVVRSGFISEEESGKRVRFVTEAEASMHYILWKQFKSIKPGDQFIICDAGGSTVDTTAYKVWAGVESNARLGSNNITIRTENNNVGNPPVRQKKKGIGARLARAFGKSKPKTPTPIPSRPSVPSQSSVPSQPSTPAIRLKELRVSDCQPAGGVFVNEAFIQYLKDMLYTQPPDQLKMVEQFIQKAEENFELHCKREFTVGPGSQPYYVVEAGVSLPDNPEGICKIDSSIVQGFFEEPVRRTIASIYSQLAGVSVKYIFLVGGFGSSKYLRRCVENEFRPLGIQVLFLDDTYGKAASDGSIIWYIKQRVVGRAARRSFGLKIMEPYNPNLPEHRHRSLVKLANGINHVPGKWSQIIERGQMVDKAFSIKKSYERMYESSNPDLGQFSVALYTWANESVPPEWVLDPNDNIIDGFEMICFISANIGSLQGALRKDGHAGRCWKLDFTFCIDFDGVELRARIEWVEKGILRSGPAQVLSD